MTLAMIQREMSAYLTGQANTAAALVRPDAARLSVYANNYRMGLIGALRDNYERVWSWLGDEQFDAACQSYIDANPPHDWTLNSYGADFAQVLAEIYPDEPDVSELAMLDWALRRAFDGPDDQAVTAAGLASFDLAQAMLRPVATRQFLTVHSNVAAIWSALQLGENAPAPEPLAVPGTLCIWRKGLMPQFRSIDAEEHQALAFIANGALFAELCGTVMAQDAEETAQRMGTLLARWIDDELISITTG